MQPEAAAPGQTGPRLEWRWFPKAASVQRAAMEGRVQALLRNQSDATLALRERYFLANARPLIPSEWGIPPRALALTGTWFPLEAGIIAAGVERVPVCLLPDPAAVRHLGAASATRSGERGQRLGGAPSNPDEFSASVLFAPGVLSGAGSPARVAVPLSGETYVARFANVLAAGKVVVSRTSHDGLAQAGSGLRLGGLGGAAPLATITTRALEPWIWTADVAQPGVGSKSCLVFPVQDANGVSRFASWNPDRTRGTRFENLVSTSWPVESLGRHHPLKFPVPPGALDAESTGAYEMVCVTEDMAAMPNPIFVIRRAPRWLPWGEDIVIDQDLDFPPPGDPREVRAVVVFATASDEQITALFKAMAAQR